MANMTNLAEALGPWLKASRWYSGGPAAVESAIELAGEWEATVLWLVLASGSTRHNVPVVLRDAAGDADDAPRPVASLGGLRVFDAAEDRDGQRALLALACGTEAVHAVASGDVGDPEATLAKLPASVRTTPAEDAPAPPARVSSAKRLTSEQSNTSIVYTMEDGERLILKIFRVLVPGSNPDVHLQAVLSDTGTVPRARGAAHLTWDGQDADVLVAQEFLGGARDAWQVITEGLADSDGSLGAAAESIPRLGELTRRIHDTLAKRCPRVEAEATDRKRIRAAWSRRAADACALVLGLEPWKERIEEVFARTENVTWPPRSGQGLGRTRLRGRAAASAGREEHARPGHARRRGDDPQLRLRHRLGGRRRGGRGDDGRLGEGGRGRLPDGIRRHRRTRTGASGRPHPR